MKIASKDPPSSGGNGIPGSPEEQNDQEEVQTVAQTENPEQPGLQLPDNAINWVPFLLDAAVTDEQAEEFLTKKLPDQAIKHFDEDFNSRSDWMSKRAEITKLLLGALEPKKEPFHNCANMHVPILATRILRIVSRVHSEMFNQGQPIFRAQAGSQISESRADDITRSENWQFSKQIPDFKAHAWRYWMDFFCFGEGIFDSYRDFVHGVNRHEYVSPDEFVYPYTRSTVAPDMSDVPRKTRIRHLYKRDLRDMEKAGFYAQVDKVISEDGTHDTGLDEPAKDVVDKFEGRSRMDHTQDAPYEILEQHTWVQLPGSKEEVPVVVVLSRKKRVVLALYSRYIPDESDRQRFNQQTQEFQQYLQAVQQFQQESQMYAQNVELYMQALQGEQALLGAIQSPDIPPDEGPAIAAAVQRERPPEPQRPVEPTKPKWMQVGPDGAPEPPRPIKQKVLERFSRGTCIDIPNSSYGIGLGTLLLPHQMAANIMLNQFIDAGTLANSNTVVMDGSIKFPKGVTTINPNDVISMQGIINGKISDHIFQFDHQPGNQQLLLGVQAQESAADAISSAPDVMSGEKEGDETFRGMATRLEQASKQSSALAAKGMIAFNQIAINNAHLNFQFMPDSPIAVDTRDPSTGKIVPVQISRELYRDSYDVVFSADLSFASRATKVAEADDALGLILKGIPPQVLPMIFELQGVGHALSKCFQARGMHDMAAYVRRDQEIAQRLMQQQQQSQQPGAQSPSIPSGQPAKQPGQAPQHRIPIGTPAQGAQEVH